MEQKKEIFISLALLLGYEIHKKSPCNENLIFNKTNKFSENSVNRSC